MVQSSIDTIQHLKSDTNGSLGDNLKTQLFNLCTEHADKIQDWKNTRMYVTRIATLTLCEIETAQLSDIVRMAKAGSNDGPMHPSKLIQLCQAVRIIPSGGHGQEFLGEASW